MSLLKNNKEEFAANMQLVSLMKVWGREEKKKKGSDYTAARKEGRNTL